MLFFLGIGKHTIDTWKGPNHFKKKSITSRVACIPRKIDTQLGSFTGDVWKNCSVISLCSAWCIIPL